MYGWCQDKTSPYDIRPEDQGLIKTAIEFGERLASSPEVTPDQREAIARMLEFLRKLPAPPPPEFGGSFGIMLTPDVPDWDGGHEGCWEVSVCRSVLEIFHVGREEGEDRLGWELCPGDTNHNDMLGVLEWIRQVANPRALVLPGQRMQITASTFTTKD